MHDPETTDFDLPHQEGPAYTLLHPASGEGKYIKRTPLKQSYGHIRVVLSPYRGPTSYRFEWRVPSGALPLPYVRASSLEGIREALLEGLSEGGRATLLHIAVVDGSYHDTDTTPLAVTIAAHLAVRDALSHAELVRT